MTLINNWTKSTASLSLTANAFVFPVGGNNYILTTGRQGDFPYFSNDGGSTWETATVSDTEWSANTTACLAAISDDGYLYLVNRAISKLYVSTDNGVTYNVASSGTSYACLACVGSTLFANFGAGTTLYKSTDHGASFTTLATPDITADTISIVSNSTCLFLCSTHTSTHTCNVYRSQDNGTTWTQILTNYVIGFVGAIFHTISSTYIGIYDVTTSALLVVKSDDNFTTSTALTTTAALLPAPVTCGGADSSNDIYFASQFIPGVLCTSSDSGATLTNETPDTVSPPISLAVGASSIVAITSSSSETSLYSGMLPGGKVLPSTPVISPASTSVLTSPVTVTLTTATSDATIYYTLDGSDPTASSTQYTAPFTLSFALPTTCIVKAVAIAGSDSSTIATRTYRIGNQVSAPTITSTPKDYAYITIAIADTTDGAVIYYTTDGTTPTIASTQYTGPFIGLEAANIIKAVAVKANYFDSDVTTTTINASFAQSDYPTLGPYLNGYMCNPQATSTRKFTTGTTAHVEMISTTNSAYDHAPIYYTLDGTTPTLASTKYTTPLDITESCVITAVAIKGTVAPVVGKVATITYTFSTGVLAKPTAYTLRNEYVNLDTGVVSTGSNSWHWYGDDSLASTFIPDYNNGVGALAISLYSIGNETPGYIYLCDPITCEPFKRVAAVTPSVSGGSYAITYSPDTGLIYAAADNLHLYSIDISTGTAVELNALLPSAIHYYLVYNVADRCLYGYCNGGTSNDLVKYNTVTNVFSTLLTNTPYAVDFCDVDTGTLYGHSNSTAGLVTIDRDTGVATPVSITTTNIYLRLIQDTASKEIYGILYPEWKTLLNAYKIDIANSTETLKFSSATTYVGTDVVIASIATTPAPLFSVAAGTYATTQSVSITCVLSNAQIYYTLDGTTPSAGSTRYTTAISISSSCTLKAVAILDGISSSITTASYSISTSVPNPRIIPGTGTFIDSVSVQITCTRIDAQIHYTLDGSAPTTASPLFTSAFTITASTTVKAIAVASGSSDSGITSEQFTIKTSLPAFSLPAGKYAPNVQIKLTCSTANAVMRYTTDGSVPTETSPVYSDHITIHATTTVKVIAYASGKIASDVMSTLYTIAHDMLFCAAWSGSHISNNMQVWGGKPGYIYSVDTSTGTVTQLPMSTARYWRDMTCSVKNKVLYACTSAQSDLGDSGLIYRIDSATGAETPITTTPHYWRGIVYDDVTDTLYGCDIVDTNLGTGGVYRINVTTGEEVLISGNTTALWSCITIDSDTGMLYIGINMTSWGGGTNTKWGTTLIGVYSLKISTGVMTCIDEANRGYKHITLNKNNGLLYLTDDNILMSMSINGGYNLISSNMDPTIGYSSITGMLISADMRVVDSTFYNVITYIDTYAYQLAEVVVAPASSGEYFQACVSISLVEEPKPDIPPGIYTEAKQVHLATETEDAVIHYTLDGSEPTINSPVYTGPLTIG